MVAVALRIEPPHVAIAVANGIDNAVDHAALCGSRIKTHRTRGVPGVEEGGQSEQETPK
jgi:hypothetical protein